MGCYMENIKNSFDKSFSNWDIKLPVDNLEKRKRGSIYYKGWIINYCFGIENGKNYMDYYAQHRMTDPSHERIYEDGTKKSLSHMQIGYNIIPNDPLQTSKNEKEMYEYNRKHFDELKLKGLYYDMTIDEKQLKEIKYKYSKKYIIEQYKMKSLEYVFFWETSKNTLNEGCFSQWQESYFEVGNIEYSCAEQFMMANKADLFNDFKTLERILNENNPKKIKKLGREIINFDESIWNNNKYSIVINGNYFKFTQNDNMKKILLNTGNKIIVEASPYDKIWGVGLIENDEDIHNPNKWLGENLLGFALMEIRDIINNQRALRITF